MLQCNADYQHIDCVRREFWSLVPHKQPKWLGQLESGCVYTLISLKLPSPDPHESDPPAILYLTFARIPDTRKLYLCL